MSYDGRWVAEMRGLVRAAVVVAALAGGVLGSLEKMRPFEKRCFSGAQPMDDVAPCVMMLSAEGTLGCAQCADELDAPLVYLTAIEELDLFLRRNTSEADQNYLRVVMIPLSLFVNPQATLLMQEYPGRVAAALVDISSTGQGTENPIPYPPVESFSPASPYPNRQYTTTPNSTYAWNPFATAIDQRILPFNMFFVNGTVATELRTLSFRFLESRFSEEVTFPRQIIQSRGQMWSCAANTSKQCLDESTCLPVGSHSVYSIVGDVPPGREVISVSAPFDSNAFVHNNFAYGATNEAIAAAALLVAAESFYSYRASAGASLPLRRTPVFLLFDTEAYGFAGSKRFLHDVQNFTCEVELDISAGLIGCRVPYMPSLQFTKLKDKTWTVDIDVAQLGNAALNGDLSGSYYLHMLNETEDDAFVREQIMAAFGAILTDSSVNSAQVGLPPITSQAFELAFEGRVPAAFIGDFDAEFRNPYYHAMFDNITELSENQFEAACSVARGLSQSLIRLAYADYETAATVNCSLVSELLDCLVGNFTDCSLAQQFLDDNTYAVLAPDTASTNYAFNFQPLPITTNTQVEWVAKAAFLESFVGYYNAINQTRIRCSTFQDCVPVALEANNNFSRINAEDALNVQCFNHECVVTNSWFHPAYGTAIISRNEDSSLFTVDEQANAQQPAWTESLWDSDLGFCSFTQDSYSYQVSILLIGLALWPLCGIFPLMHWILARKARKRESEELPKPV